MFPEPFKKAYENRAIFVYGILLIIYTVKPQMTSIKWFMTNHMLQLSILLFIFPLIFLSKIELRFIKTRTIQVYVIFFIFSLLFTIYHFPVTLRFFQSHPSTHDYFIFFLLSLSFYVWIKFMTYQNRSIRSAHRLSLLLLPACMFLLIEPMISTQDSWFSLHASGEICFSPALDGMMNKYDSFFAGLVMFICHKFSLHFGSCIREGNTL